MGRKISAFMLALFALCSLAFSMGDKELTRLNGNVEVRHIAESTWLSVFSSRLVDDTDWIRTHEASLARLDFHNGRDSATIFERTIVEIENVDPEKVSLRQWIGKIEVVVRHLFLKPIPVEVTTPSAVMAVRGSVADCRVLPDGTTYVNASSGHIDVTAAGRTLSITGGQLVIVHPGAPPVLIQSLRPTTAPKAASATEDKSNYTKNDQPSNNKNPSQPQQPVSNQANSSQSNSLAQQGDSSKPGGPQGLNFGPPPGTIVTHNSDGTVTYSYSPKPGQEQPKEIPPEVVKRLSPDGTITYTFTTTPEHNMGPGPMNQSTAGPGGPGAPVNGPLYFGSPPPGMPMNQPGYSGPPPGTVMTNNPNGTVTYSYSPKPGQEQPKEIPPGVVKRLNPDGTVTYTFTTTPEHNMGPGGPGLPMNPSTAGPGGPGDPVNGLPSFGSAPPGAVVNGPMNLGSDAAHGAPSAGINPTYAGAVPNYSGPPPGTVITNNANGTVTYTYMWRPGMSIPPNVPPGVVATPTGNGGITYTFTAPSSGSTSSGGTSSGH